MVFPLWVDLIGEVYTVRHQFMREYLVDNWSFQQSYLQGSTVAAALLAVAAALLAVAAALLAIVAAALQVTMHQTHRPNFHGTYTSSFNSWSGEMPCTLYIKKFLLWKTPISYMLVPQSHHHHSHHLLCYLYSVKHNITSVIKLNLKQYKRSLLRDWISPISWTGIVLRLSSSVRVE